MTFHCSHAGPLAIPQTLQEGSNLRIFTLAVPSAGTHPPNAQIAIMPIPYLWVTIQMLPSQWLTLVILLKTTKRPPLQYCLPYVALRVYFCFVHSAYHLSISFITWLIYCVHYLLSVLWVLPLAILVQGKEFLPVLFINVSQVPRTMPGT